MRGAVALLMLVAAACSTSRGDDAGVDLGADAGVDFGVDLGWDAGVDFGIDFGPARDCGVDTPRDASATDPTCMVRATAPTCTGGTAGAYFDGTRCVETTTCADFPSLAACASGCARAGHCDATRIGAHMAPIWIADYGACHGSACGGGPPSVCVATGHPATETAIRSLLPLAECAEVIGGFTECLTDGTERECDFRLPDNPTFGYPSVDLATWYGICAATLLPEVRIVGCDPAVLI